MDKTTVTVKRNWKKKIEALTEGNPEVFCYSLHNCFSGKLALITDVHEWLVKELDQKYPSLQYNKETGACCLYIHSNLWFDWTKKINW